MAVVADSVEEGDLPEEDEVSLSNRLVHSGGSTQLEFSVGRILLADEVQFSEIIFIAEVGSTFVVALPASVWARRVSQRRLHPRGLSKPILCSIVAGLDSDRTRTDDACTVKAWIGLLAKDQEALVEFGESIESDFSFVDQEEEVRIPHADALVTIASEHFAFQSAESGLGGEVPNAGPQEDVQTRLQSLEKGLEAIQNSLASLVQQKSERTRDAKPVSILKASPKPKPGAVKFAGLDQSVVAAALSAGVTHEHLEQMAEVLTKNPSRMEDIPRTSRPKKNSSELSESDEEDEEEEVVQSDGSKGGASGDGMVAKALVKLTKVCSSLANQRAKTQGIEGILDSAGASGSAENSLSSRKHAVALRALKKCLQDNPEYLYKTIESLLVSDFQSKPHMPGEPIGTCTTRGWLESRSRIQNYQAHVRWVWQVSGIWDALIRGDHHQARARCALLVAAGDQAAIDGGQWLLASECLLEGPPPYQSFSHHSPPGPQEMQHSVLLDARWMELFVARIKDLDSYNETKKKLGGKGTRRDEKTADKEEPIPRPKPKPRPKAKGAGKNDASSPKTETE